MEYKIIQLPETYIVGKEGLCTEGHNIVSELWQEANSHFNEVAELGKKENDGTYVGFWGAMSDETKSFQPWTNNFSRGLYLAGIEVSDEVLPPDGWVKWVLPARMYLVIDVDFETYGQIFNEVINNVIPNNKMKLIGAVCDFTDPKTGQNKLYFPIEHVE